MPSSLHSAERTQSHASAVETCTSLAASEEHQQNLTQQDRSAYLPKGRGVEFLQKGLGGVGKQNAPQSEEREVAKGGDESDLSGEKVRGKTDMKALHKHLSEASTALFHLDSRDSLAEPSSHEAESQEPSWLRHGGSRTCVTTPEASDVFARATPPRNASCSTAANSAPRSNLPAHSHRTCPQSAPALSASMLVRRVSEGAMSNVDWHPCA